MIRDYHLRLGSPLLAGLVALVVLGSTPGFGQTEPNNHSRIELSEQAELDAFVTQLDLRLSQLVDEADLLDSLYYDWLGRPYARATLAVLVKTRDALRDEFQRRQTGSKRMSDQDLSSARSWSTDALTRIVSPRRTNSFRPHRIEIREADLRESLHVPPLFSFLSPPAETDAASPFRGLDLAAAMGQRLWAFSIGQPIDANLPEVSIARARALGMVAAGHLSPDARGESTALPDGSPVMLMPLTLRELITHPPRSDAPGGRLAMVIDPAGGESWPASFARRALARGATGRQRFGVSQWRTPLAAGQGLPTASASRLAAWLHALDGQRIAVVSDWSSRTDEQEAGNGFPGFDPAATEALAHTALDLLESAERIDAFAGQPLLALAVGPDAVDPNDPNRWAAWAEPIWAGLLDRQIRFDVVPQGAVDDGVRQEYRVVFSLRRITAVDPWSAILRLRLRLGIHPEHVNRITARGADGLIAPKVWVRRGRTAAGRPCLAIANLSAAPQALSLRGGGSLGPQLDLMTGERFARPAEVLGLSPYQLRLLWPDR